MKKPFLQGLNTILQIIDMAEVIGFIIILLCIVTCFIILLKGAANKKVIKKNQMQVQEKQEEVESRIRKIEDLYGEKATLIMFQEFHVPNICELIVILEEAQIVLILGEAYNFSEILNLKIEKSDYIRSKHTSNPKEPINTLEQAATGVFSANTIKESLLLLEETQESITCLFAEKVIKIEIMTSRLTEPVISISPSHHTTDEVIIALSMIIDKNEDKWGSVELPSKPTIQRYI